jgi:uncharacterized protein DUF29
MRAAGIVRSRTEIMRLLDYSPELNGQLTEYVAAAYDDAKNDAGVDIRLERHQWEELFAVACPWTLEQIQSPDYFPSTDSSEKS